MISEEMSNIFIGLDLGGTHIRGAVTDQQGEVIYYRMWENPIAKPIPINFIISTIRKLLKCSEKEEKFNLLGIGFATAGSIRHETGIVLEASNLRWKNVPIGDELQNAFGVPVSVLNDTNAAALGEYTASQQTLNNFMCITIGTGVGSGLILNGELYIGNSGNAGEIGHMVVNPLGDECVCGNKGCLETVASAPAIIRDFKLRAAKECTDHELKNMFLHNTDSIDVYHIVEAAKRNDQLSISLITQVETVLGRQLANISNLLDIERFVLAGGVSKMDWPFIDNISKKAKSNVISSKKARLNITKSTLIDLSAIIGSISQLKKKLKH